MAILNFSKKKKKNCVHKPLIMYYFTTKKKLMILHCFPVTGGNIKSDEQKDGVQSYSSSVRGLTRTMHLNTSINVITNSIR